MQCFSVPRLLHQLGLSEPISRGQVAGVLKHPYGSADFAIWGQGALIEFQVQSSAEAVLLDFRDGDHVTVGFELEGPAKGNVLYAKNVQVQGLSPLNALGAGGDLTGKAKEWSDFTAKVRSYFSSLGMLEVETPTLVRNPGMEPHLIPFKTTWFYGSQNVDLYLPTSPELHLKQLLAKGFTDIFQMARAFRNEELSEIHEPEFTMLEWYRAYADLDLIQKDLIGLLKVFKPELQVEVTTMAKLFQQHLGVNLSPTTSREELLTAARETKVDHRADDSWDDLFHRLFFERIEPIFAAAGPEVCHIVGGFPSSQAALAQLRPDGMADRFELYWNGLEIANAYNELTDPDEQLRRQQQDLVKRKELGRELLPIDWKFIEALKEGVPPCGGIALGLDRLFMAVYGYKCIQDIRTFSIHHELQENQTP